MESVAQGSFSSLVFLGALLVVIAFLLFRSQRYFGRQERASTPPLDPPPPSPQRPAHHLGSPGPLVQWEVEMHDVARDLGGQLDSKMVALEHLIREADRAAARLETALEAMKRECAALPSIPPAAQEAERPKQHPATPYPTHQAGALTMAGPAEEPARPLSRSVASSERLPADRRYEEIYLLADYGFEPADIAHRVGMPIGEIQLILSLRAKR